MAARRKPVKPTGRTRGRQKPVVGTTGRSTPASKPATQPELADADAPEFEPDSTYPLLAPSDVLRTIISFSRDVTADLRETNLTQLLLRTLRQLLPERLIAIRTIDPSTLRAVELHADAGLVDDALELRPTIQRGALDYANVRQNLPDNLRATDGSGRVIEIVDEHPLIFRDAVAGFSVPLLAGGELTGEVHVNYRAVIGRRGVAAVPPLRQDKGLVIPIANHVAVVGHTRRLLRQTEYLQDYLQLLIDQANVLILATDAGGRVTVWNRAMNRLTGFPRDKVIGRDLLPWLGELDVPDVGLLIKQVAASLEPSSREVRLPSAGGATLRALFNAVVVRGHGGEVAATLAIGQDVTALRQLQSQIIQAEKLATVGQIAAGVAHEINNPLMSIQVCAEAVLRKATLQTPGKTSGSFDISDIDRLRKIQEGAERIKRFARDLVSYARPSGAKAERAVWNDVIEQGLSFCEHVIEGAHAVLERDYGKDLPGAHVVRDQILQIVINLVTNAAHAVAESGGTIRVRTWGTRDATVSVAVSDSGIGIRDEDRAHVFEPFFTTKPAGKGSGLGLSVVRNIVNAHGGQISFQSRPGGGTTFVVTVPVNHFQPFNPPGDKAAR
jgi:PAS domain S-box-containing protein